MVAQVRVDPERLQQFALAYAPAVLDALRSMGPWNGAITVEAYAIEITQAMAAAIERAGVSAVEHYYLNSRGGALRQAGLALGLDGSTEALAHFIGGRS